MTMLERFAAAVIQDRHDTEAARASWLRLRARDYVEALIAEPEPTIIERMDADAIADFRLYIPSELAKRGYYLEQIQGGWSAKKMEQSS